MNMKHHLECVGNGHDKFWQIVVNGSSFTTTWGRNGTAGTSQTKHFANEYKCMDAARKLLNEKFNKGYKTVPFPSTAYQYKMVDVDLDEAENRIFGDCEPCIL